jgi:hypothetical protein
MLNIADTLHRVHGSAPLPPGTSVAVDEDGNVVGSISGGCVEGAVYELCRQVLRDRGTLQGPGSATPTTTPWPSARPAAANSTSSSSASIPQPSERASSSVRDAVLDWPQTEDRGLAGRFTMGH